MAVLSLYHVRMLKKARVRRMRDTTRSRLQPNPGLADCTNLSCPSLFVATLPDSVIEPLLVLCRGDDAIL